MLKAAQAYLSTQINTTSQGEILLMLYGGAIKFLTQAKERIEAKDYAEKGILISKALDVIAELDGSLNADKGGEVAQNLHKLYFYCNTRLLRANLEMNVEYVDEVIKIMEAMRNAFTEITQAEGMAAEGQARSIAEAADKAKRPEAPAPVAPETMAKKAPSPTEGPAPMAGATYGPGADRFRPVPGAAPETAPAQDAHVEPEPAAEAPEARTLQEVPRRPTNLRMVAKLKAYHRAGG